MVLFQIKVELLLFPMGCIDYVGKTHVDWPCLNDRSIHTHVVATQTRSMRKGFIDAGKTKNKQYYLQGSLKPIT